MNHNQPSSSNNRIWFVSELYYPEETSTGYALTKIAEHLAHSFPVQVLCGQPSYAKRGTKAPWKETHNGVQINRVAAFRFDKDRLLGRMLNLLTISVAILWHALFLLRRGDRVLVVTNPPTLPFFIAPVCWLKGAKCILRIEDVYPDALVAAGFAKPKSVLVSLWSRLAAKFYSHFDCIVVLGRDMYELIAERTPVPMKVIRYWADSHDIVPIRHEHNPIMQEFNLLGQFIIQYAGNMGRTHDMRTLTAAAALLADNKNVRFMFAGWGKKRAWLQESTKDMPNVLMLPNQPRSRSRYLLTACDLAVISLVPGMSGVSVPCRLYNMLASGRPVIAVADETSEIARIVREERVGWVVRPGDAAGFADAVREAYANPALLAEMGVRARAAAEHKYSFAASARQYVELFSAL